MSKGKAIMTSKRPYILAPHLIKSVDGPLSFSVWDELGANKPPETAEIAAWEAQMEQLLSAEREELEHDYGADMQRAWNTNSNAFQEDALQLDDAGYPVLSSYTFGL